MENIKYYIGLDVHKQKTTYVIRDKTGNIIQEGITTTSYSELFKSLETYLKSSIIGLESSTSYYTLYKKFLKSG